MVIKKIIIFCICLCIGFFILSSVVFSYNGEKYDYFYQDAISKLYTITPYTWEIKIQKGAEPYGYKESTFKGIFVSFKGRTKVKPLYPKRTSDYESFYLIIMPPDFIMEENSDPRQAMAPDRFLGETDGHKIFYRITGTVEGVIPTWLNWEKDIKNILKIK